MSAPIAEAYVELRVDSAKVETGVKSAMADVEIKGEAAAEGVEASFRDAAEAMERDFDQAAQQMKADLESVGDDAGGGLLDKFTGVGGKAGSGFMAAFSPALLAGGGVGAVGAAAAAALVVGFQGYMGREDLAAGLETALGLTEEQAARAGAVAGGLYRDGWGDSLDDVGAAVEATLASFPGLNDTDLATISEGALAIAEAFDVDVAQAAAAAGIAVKNGLAKDGQEALDSLTAGLQKMPVQFRDELFEANNEYGKFFAQLGITGDETFGMLAAAAEDGIYGIDKTGDAIKELSIRATDGSKSTVDAFEAIGLNSDEMAAKILAGGDKGREGFDAIVDGLLGMEDPAARANAAIALFGTPLEDLGTGEIPAFLGSLDAMTDSLGDTEGAAADMADTLTGTTAQQLEQFKREALGTLVDFFVNVVVPAVQEVATWVREDLVPRMQELYEAWKPYIDLVVEYFVYLWDQLQLIFQGIVTAVEIFLDILSGDWASAWEGIKQLTSLAMEFVRNLISMALSAIGTMVRGALSGVADTFRNIWNGIKQFVSETWRSITSTVSNGVSDLVGFVTSIPGRIASGVSGAFDAIWTNFKKVLNRVIDAWNGLRLPSFKIGGWDPPGPGPSFPSITIPSIGTPRIPRLAQGGITDGPMLALLGDNSSGREAVVPLERASEFGFGQQNGPVLNIENANFYDGTDADVVAQRTMMALSARRAAA